jgi:hypothetical protein
MDLDRLGEFAHGLRQRAELPEPNVPAEWTLEERQTLEEEREA